MGARIYAAGFIGIVAAAGIVGFQAWERPIREAKPGRVKVALPGEQVLAGANDTEQLRARLAILEASLNGLRAERSARPLIESEPAQPTVAPESPASETVHRDRAKEAQEWHERMQLVEDSFQMERTDAKWSSQTASAITGVSRSAAIQALRLTVDCRTKTCKVVIPDDGSGSAGRAVSELIDGLAAELPNGRADYVQDAAGHKRTVLYLSRESAEGKPPT